MNGAPGRENSFQSLLRSPWVDRRFFSISSNARGFTLPVGWLPALKALNLLFPRALSIASAMMLRAELPVHRNRTLNGSFAIIISFTRSGRRFSRLDIRGRVVQQTFGAVHAY